MIMESVFLSELNQNRSRVERSLEKWKTIFYNEIGSVRNRSRIKTLYDLIDCLERHDVLIKSSNESYKLSEQVNACSDEVSAARQNVYANLRQMDECQQKNANKNENNNNSFISNFGLHKQLIYKLIAREIGSYWRSFGRELHISQGMLDDIQIRYPYDLKSQVYKLLETFEDNQSYNTEQHAEIICHALDECRRKDLRRKIENILHHYK